MKSIDTASAVKKADELFQSGWNCAESVFIAVHSQAASGEAPVQLVTGLGGGMGCKRTCGAVSGAQVALGLVFGRTTADEAAKKIAMAKASALCKAFRVTYHSLDCWELTSGFDSDADRRRYCTSLVTTAVELACEAIAD